jgi:mannose-6-phosphate isomerase-like protein (cupin superfamily)
MERKKPKRSNNPSSSGSSRNWSTKSDDFLTDSARLARNTRPEESESLGDRLRKAREKRGFTLQELSSCIGTDVDTLKRMEENEMLPPLGELVRLSKALETRMSYLISSGVEEPMCLVRADQRKPVSRRGEKGVERYGYSYESLASGKANRMMEPFIVTLVPTEAAETSTHDGQEFLFVLEGRMMARVGDRTEFLEPGDAIYYDSTNPHYVRCVGENKAKVLAIIYPERS